MRHRRSVTDNRNFSRTGEGHRNVRASVARALLVADFDGETLATPPTDAEMWEAERALEDAREIAWEGFDSLRDCCFECARAWWLTDVADEAHAIVNAYYA